MTQPTAKTASSYVALAVDTTIHSWQEIPQPDLEGQAPGTRGEAKALTRKLAQDQIARTRQNALGAIAKKKVDPQTRWALRIVAALVGTITLSAGSQILTARLGPIGVPAALGVAGALAFIDNRCMTRAHTNHRLRVMTRNALTHQTQTVQNHPPTNEFGTAAHQATLDAIQQVEGDPEIQTFPANASVGTLLNGAELAVNCWIVAQLGLPGGIVLVGLVSLIPIGIQLAAAIADSETGELPEEAASLQDEYQLYRWPWEQLSSAEQADERYQIQKLDVALRFLPHGDPSGECKTLAMALAKSDSQHYTRQKQHLEVTGVEQVHQREQQHQQALKALPAQFPAPVTPEAAQSSAFILPSAQV